MAKSAGFFSSKYLCEWCENNQVNFLLCEEDEKNTGWKKLKI